jgi:L-rhamnose mutarotase
MQRVGQVLKLRGHAKDEYKQCHTDVWPEVRQALIDAGVHNYSIFCYGSWLFSYYELPDDVAVEDVHAVISKNPACQRWEELMHRLQEPLPESGGADWWVAMEDVWHIDDNIQDVDGLQEILVSSPYAE